MQITEASNPRTANLDRLSSLEIVTLINQEDAGIASAIHSQLPQIAQAVDLIVSRMQQGGRLFYFGAGTSGRLGVLDASEIPPTYSTPPDLVQGFIAGGDRALRHSVEAAEDDTEAGRQTAHDAGVRAKDVLVGITASGGAPWVIGAAQEARRHGAAVIGLVCSPGGPLEALCDLVIVPVVGPEVIAGSTRMKAGTAQKMVLNMISSAVMVQLGKVYGNLMVDVRPSNQKLKKRAERIVQTITGVNAGQAAAVLEQTTYAVKPALVMILAGVSLQEAQERLEAANGHVSAAIAAQDSKAPGQEMPGQAAGYE